MALNHEYNLPQIYECEYGGYTDDFDIFCNTVTKGNALDVACGTGRVTTKLAALGLKCIGSDESQSMLDHAKQKAKEQDLDIAYLNMDMRHINLNQKFDLVTMAGNSFQVLLTEEDQVSCLISIREHMAPNSLFIMNTRNTTIDEMQTTDQFEHWHNFTDDKGCDVKVYGMQTFDAKTNVVKYTTKRMWQNFETLSDIELKFTSYEALSDLLKIAGLTIHEAYGNFNKTSFDSQTSKDIIIICKKI